MNPNNLGRWTRLGLAVAGVALLAAVPAGGVAWAAGGRLVWSDRFDTGLSNSAEAIAANANRVFVAGAASNPITAYDMIVRAYDAGTGALLWQNRQGTGAYAAASAITTIGTRVFATGGTFRSGWKGLVRAYDVRSGAILWESVANGAYLRAIAAHGPRVFATGERTTTTTIGPGLVRAYAAGSGDLLWEATIGTQAYVTGVAALGPSVFVGAFLANGQPRPDYLVRAYDAQTGELRWEDHEANGWAAAITTQGTRVIAVGALMKADGNPEPLVRVYDAASGARLWENRQAAGDFGGQLGSVVVRNSWVVAAGLAFDNVTSTDILVRAYDLRTGALLWEDQHDGGASADDWANSLAVTSLAVTGDRVAVAGSISTSVDEQFRVDEQFFVRAYELDSGAPAWEDTQGGPDVDMALAVVALGNRFFTAGVFTGTDLDSDFVVRAYESH